MMQGDKNKLKTMLSNMFKTMDEVLAGQKAELKSREVGTVTFIGRGIARVSGLPGVKAEELVSFPGGVTGMALNLDPEETGIILFGERVGFIAGSDVYRTGSVMSVPVGGEMLGRVVDAVGNPLDNLRRLRITKLRPVEREAPAIMDRSSVTVPLQTGIKVIDALIPIGRGQRELILGDRQTGKTAIALDTIVNQRNKGVICVYCAIGQRSSSVAKLIADLRKYEAIEYSIVVVAAGEDPPGMKFIAPYSATTMAEYFMEQGKDVLIIYDDLTIHARAYRELSLLLRRPPGREAFPGDIFYIHSRLLERSTHLRKKLGGGSLTALPIIETEAQNVAAYIPTNLISITDGQIYLSPDLFQKGILPAVDVGKSVSRVGGKTQFPSYRTVAGDLRLAYSQFEELEKFARFSTRLDESTRKTLDRGRRVREILKQPQYQPLSVSEQISVLIAVNADLFDEMGIDEIAGAEKKVRTAVKKQLADICDKIESGKKLSDDDQYNIITTARGALGIQGRL
jgi:F-type H+-transporting ATPase subunit alpha